MKCDSCRLWICPACITQEFDATREFKCDKVCGFSDALFMILVGVRMLMTEICNIYVGDFLKMLISISSHSEIVTHTV